MSLGDSTLKLPEVVLLGLVAISILNTEMELQASSFAGSGRYSGNTLIRYLVS